MKNSAIFAKKRLLIIGAVHVDDIAKPESTLVPLASNPVTWSRHIGGVAANAACAAARTMEDAHIDQPIVEFLAAVGDDDNAAQLMHTLDSLNVKTRFKHFTNTATGRYSAIMNHDGELYIGLSDVSLAEKLSKSMVDELTDWNGVAAVLLDANLSKNCLAQVAKHTAEYNIPIAAMSVSPIKTQRLVPLAQDIDVLFCNRREATAMLPQVQLSTTTDCIADELSLLGFLNFVLTDGSNPVLVQQATMRTHVSVPQIECTHHVNGAGDSLAGATFLAWAGGMNLAESLELVGLPASAQIVTGLYNPPTISNPTANNSV